VKKSFAVDDRIIGPGYPTFVIAELGINHNGDPEIAHQMIDAAAKAGVDAVKFQTYRTETFIAKGNPYYDIFRQCEMSDLETLRKLQRHAEERGVVFFSSAADIEGLNLLVTIDVPLIKLSSANITNLPLLRRAAQSGRPLIFSSGGATLAEISMATETLAETGADSVAILKCTSIYPCPPERVNLMGIKSLRAVFDCPIGFSDHTVGVEAAVAAVALGAGAIEKHFTLDHNMEGHDHHFSADPFEIKRLVDGVRSVEAMRGSDRLEPVSEEIEFRRVGRRYVTAVVDIMEGTVIESAMIAVRRPSGNIGIPPANTDVVVGRSARRDIEAGESIRWEDI